MLPISLYIHFPWCIKKCPYCDFNSHPLKQSLPEKAYIERLVQDLQHHASYFQGRKIQSIFMGGGTPSLFSSQSMAELLEAVDQTIPIEQNAEITMEANPAAIEHDRFSGYKVAGINRISLGAQTFNAQHLKVLGRIHDDNQIHQAVDQILGAGFENFNLDLMFGLPDQTLEEACFDLETAIKLGPRHLSWYQLTLEPQTPFFHKPPKNMPLDDLVSAIQIQGQTLLEKAGFAQYEVSAYAQGNSYKSQHNLNYWQFGDYLGIGAGAHSKITLYEDQKFYQMIRFMKEKFPNEYLKPDHYKKNISQTVDNILFEFLMNALRLKSGFSLQDFENKTGLTSNDLLIQLSPAISNQLIDYDSETAWIRPTSLGFLHLDSILVELV